MLSMAKVTDMVAIATLGLPEMAQKVDWTEKVKGLLKGELKAAKRDLRRIG